MMSSGFEIGQRLVGAKFGVPTSARTIMPIDIIFKSHIAHESLGRSDASGLAKYIFARQYLLHSVPLPWCYESIYSKCRIRLPIHNPAKSALHVRKTKLLL